MRPTEAIDASITAHRRLERALEPLTDADVQAPSRLEGWTRGHVLAHLAHKTGSHIWLIGGAEAGEVRHQYPAGYAHAQADVEAGSGRPASELRADLSQSFLDLEAAWERLADDRWKHEGICVPGPRTMVDIVFRHLRDVEVHHVDLDIGLSVADWSDVFVGSELPKRVAGLPQRADRASLLAWLLGRAEPPELGPW